MEMREIYVYAAFTMGVLGLLEYFFNVPFIGAIVGNFQNWIVIMSSVMLGMGAYNNLSFNISKIKNKRLGWPYSIVCVVSFVLMMLLGLYVKLDIQRPEWFFWYNNIATTASSALWAIALFYIVSAAFRAMRPRNLDAAILLMSAVLVIFNNAPVAGAIHPALPAIGAWTFKLAAETGMRALLIGIAIGVTSLGLRVIMGREKRALGGFD